MPSLLKSPSQETVVLGAAACGDAFAGCEVRVCCSGVGLAELAGEGVEFCELAVDVCPEGSSCNKESE